MKPRIRLGIVNFWQGFDPAHNSIVDLLRTRYEIELTDERPDFLLYSCFGKPGNVRRHKCTRIFYTGENVRPDFMQCDFAFTFDRMRNPRNYRLPIYWLMYPDLQQLVKPAAPADPLAGKTAFCNFVYSNPNCAARNRFFELLSKYKRVDAGGRLFNNLGYRIGDKLEFLRRYKFTIAFENYSQPGYTTEKIVGPMLAGSLPIYWGDPQVHLDFNPRSFISYYDCGDMEALVERAIAVDRDDALYAEYFRHPWLHDNRVPAELEAENILARFDEIFAMNHKPVALDRNPLRIFLINPVRHFSRKIRKEAAELIPRMRRKRLAKNAQSAG